MSPPFGDPVPSGFHSRGLVHWRRLGSALDRPSQLDLDGCAPSRGLFAATIRHHDGVFPLVCTLMDGPGRFVVTATDPAGPWSEPRWLEGEGFDPSLFFDEGSDGEGEGNGEGGDRGGDGGGRAWFLPRERRLTGPEYVLWSGSRAGTRWVEAPHLYKVDGSCLLLTAEGGTEADHSVVAARARHVTGPYEGVPGNPVPPPATGPVACTGHADLVRTPDGDWRAVLLGVRRGSAIGRETFLARVTWSDGRPVFSPAGRTGPRTHPRLHDDFAALSADRSTLRTPRTPFRTTGDGGLRLRPERLGGRGTPSLLVRPQEQPACDVSTALPFTPAAPYEQAGLAVVLDDDARLLPRTAEGLTLRRGPEVLARADLAPGGVWRELATVESGFLAPRFTSVQVGLYATSDGHPSADSARFTRFDLTYPPTRPHPRPHPRPRNSSDC
ncbi:glycoside hydrolase family 43 protein [Streptomyces sp. R302]|uniref:family 43 glycosylhydrolase n=1 Tax=unclassified Streptomyces TaxID=2593676 RepID=UPI00145C5DAC|nr:MULTISPECIES: family 43 glycosylhydrolase [unclassified Streptomyces]NML50686.1 glycoside hydrolase family 43 protein [Streptomyces sp. R301]NML80781.1 glycoside hydrolase family 43 protein [Streptomyces sp. R302]